MYWKEWHRSQWLKTAVEYRSRERVWHRKEPKTGSEDGQNPGDAKPGQNAETEDKWTRDLKILRKLLTSVTKACVSVFTWWSASNECNGFHDNLFSIHRILFEKRKDQSDDNSHRFWGYFRSCQTTELSLGCRHLHHITTLKDLFSGCSLVWTVGLSGFRGHIFSCKGGENILKKRFL